jgi:hypothetical protein
MLCSSSCRFRSLLRNSAARCSRNLCFSSIHFRSHILIRSTLLDSSIRSNSLAWSSFNASSSCSLSSGPLGRKQKSKSSSCTAAIRGSSSEVTSMPLSLSNKIFARLMSSKAYASCTWSSSEIGGGGDTSWSGDIEAELRGEGSGVRVNEGVKKVHWDWGSNDHWLDL